MKTGLFYLWIICLLHIAPTVYARQFTVFDEGRLVQIYVSPQEEAPLHLAAHHLQQDLLALTGVTPTIVTNQSDLRGNVIYLGTAVHSSVCDESALVGLYESYLIESVKPIHDEVDHMLAIVGSDPLGAAFGTYQFSEKLGVSPLYWWCDLVPERKEKIILNDYEVKPSQPAVRYRGLFINDEEASILWSQASSKIKGQQGITPETYKRVYELMLRLGANVLWPGMMEEGSYFFEAKDEHGVAINPKNATDYGVYIGTSHCENMARNNNAEWYEWAAHHAHLFEDDRHEFDYTVNPRAIDQYWKERLEESRHFNIIYTLGIRAVHDSEFRHRKLENPTLANKVKVIQRVIDRQRELITEVFGSADAVPQLFTPYEEMAEFYNGETKNGDQKCKGLELPDDVMIITTDDNFGYLRQLPTVREVNRKGGSGVYYHLAYQGNPSPYDWLTTMPFAQMQQELNKLHDVGATSFWIVNVGDIKPSEFALQYFLDTAHDPSLHLNQDPRHYVEQQAQHLFALEKDQAVEFASLFTEFNQLANRHKPEFATSSNAVNFDQPHWIKFCYYSCVDFNDEAQRMIDDYVALEQRAKAIYDALPASRQHAFWHLAYYPIRSSRLMAEKSYYFHKNVIYANQGRFSSVNAYKNRSQEASAAIDQDLHYYNKVLAQGKWDKIMDPYATYNIYERVVDDACIPKDLVYKQCYLPQAKGGLGAVCEGQLHGNEDFSLLFSSLEDNKRFIDLFAKGSHSESFTLTSEQPWITFSNPQGLVAVEERIWVSIDWKRLPTPFAKGEICVIGNQGEVKRFKVEAQKIIEKIKSKTYVEGAGFVAIEAENYTRKKSGRDQAQWVEINDLGYAASSMVVHGGEKPKDLQHAASLTYRIYFTSTGKFDVTLYRLPTLNEGKGKTIEMGVALDDQPPFRIEGIRRKDQTLKRTLVNGTHQFSNWRTNAYAQIEKIPFQIHVDEPGYHDLTLYQVDDAVGVDRIVIATREQSSMQQARSLFGAPESYRTDAIYASELPSQVEFSKEQVHVGDYPQLEPMLYAKFIFATHGIPSVWGFTPVSTRHHYDAQSTLFGWDPQVASQVKSRHIVGSRSLPFFRLFSHRGTQPASFFAQMHEGNYEVTIHTGNITSYYSGQKGEEYLMNIHANGKTLVENLEVKSDQPYVGRFDVQVGKDHQLKLDFSGRNWGISVIEIYRK